MRTVAVLNGPNLNLLGQREPEIYGKITLQEIEQLCRDAAKSVGYAVDFRQTNHEGTLIDWTQECGKSAVGLVINPAALGHTSIALMDTLYTLTIPVIEVHLSNIYRREPFRHHTFTARAVKGVISGFGAHGYVMAMHSLMQP